MREALAIAVVATERVAQKLAIDLEKAERDRDAVIAERGVAQFPDYWKRAYDLRRKFEAAHVVMTMLQEKFEAAPKASAEVSS
ncbi:MAG: hypothetical protein AAGG69_02135 [Pseudomonadota bacterium]